MNIKELAVGDSILVQSEPAVKELATIKAFLDDDNVLVKLSDGRYKEMASNYILKSFGQ